MDTDSYIVHVETEDFYKDIADDVEKWFDTSGYDKKLDRLLPIGKNKKVLEMFKDELNGEIITEVQMYGQSYMRFYGKITKVKY